MSSPREVFAVTRIGSSAPLLVTALSMALWASSPLIRCPLIRCQPLVWCWPAPGDGPGLQAWAQKSGPRFSHSSGQSPCSASSMSIAAKVLAPFGWVLPIRSTSTLPRSTP
jgi:hypothetical protein